MNFMGRKFLSVISLWTQGLWSKRLKVFMRFSIFLMLFLFNSFVNNNNCYQFQMSLLCFPIKVGRIRITIFHFLLSCTLVFSILWGYLIFVVISQTFFAEEESRNHINDNGWWNETFEGNFVKFVELNKKQMNYWINLWNKVSVPIYDKSFTRNSNISRLL